ncbi:MAG: ABC transporter ATP-binding protein/permease [Planctomycetota bacterium]|nr:ABC transporter ATP-binding protein/permease [Planctomycetota bacterium]
MMAGSASSDFREEEILGRAYDWRLIKRFLAYLKPYKSYLVLIVLVLLLLTFVGLVTPLIMKKALDGPIKNALNAIDKTPFLRELFYLGILYLAALCARFGLSYAQVYLVRLVGQGAIHDLRCSLFSHLQKLSLSFFSKNPVGRLVTRVTNDIEALNELFASGIVALLNDAFILFGIIIILATVSWRMTLVAMVIVPPLILITLLFRRKARYYFGEIRRRLARLNAFINESFLGIRVIQMFNKQNERSNQHSDLNKELLKEYKSSNLCTAIFYPAIEVLGSAGTCALIYYASFAIHSGVVTLGEFFLFWSLLGRFFGPIMDLVDKYSVLQSAMASAERIFRIMDTQPDVQMPPDGHTPSEVKGEIRLENVSFSYNNHDVVLKDINLVVKPGERVALVGPTGAGKTSIINLVARFYDPQKGRVLIDGVDVRHWNGRALRSSLAIVPQDVFIFYGTVKENISLWDENISEERLKEAARAAKADDFIRNLENGYDTVMAERGATLSAGQRQLLSFARAIARKPPIIVLDEATSSIDSETEHSIQEAMENTLKGRTALIIAHRLSTIEKCDRILVVDEGRIVEEGTHSELLKRQGLYSCLYRMQGGRF